MCDASEGYQISKYIHELALQELLNGKSDGMVILEGVTHYQDGDMVCSQEHFAGDKAYKIKSAFEGP